MRVTRFRDPTTILTVLALLALPILAWLRYLLTAHGLGYKFVG